MAQVLLQNSSGQKVYVDNTSPDYQAYLAGGFKPAASSATPSLAPSSSSVSQTQYQAPQTIPQSPVYQQPTPYQSYQPKVNAPPGYEQVDFVKFGLKPVMDGVSTPGQFAGNQQQLDLLNKAYGNSITYINGVAFGKPDPNFDIKYRLDGTQRRIQTYPDGSVLDLDTKEVLRQAGGISTSKNTGNSPQTLQVQRGNESPITVSLDAYNQIYAKNGYSPINTDPFKTYAQNAPNDLSSNAFGDSGLPGVDTNGWSSAMTQSFQALQDYVKTLQNQGKVVNPSITITPEMTAKFLDQAKTEINPYYSQIIKQAQDDIQRSFTRTSEDYSRRERDIGLQYGKALENTQEDFARRGLAFSSRRDEAEKNLATEATTALEDAQRQAQRQAQDIGTQGERTLGSSLFNSNASIRTGSTPIVNRPGQYGLQTGTGTRNLFTPTGGVTGEIERRKLFDEKQRVQELENNERSLRALNYQ